MSAYNSYLDRSGRSSYGGLGSYRSSSNGIYKSGLAGSRERAGPTAAAASSRQAETPSLRYGSTARFGSQIARSPLSEKSPTVFGVAGALEEDLVLVSRSTSPTAPAESAFLRDKRAAKEPLETREVPRPGYRPPLVDSAAQTEPRRPAPAASRYASRPLGRPTDLPVKPDPPLRASSFLRSSLEPKSPSPDLRTSYSRTLEPRSPVESRQTSFSKSPTPDLRTSSTSPSRPQSFTPRTKPGSDSDSSRSSTKIPKTLPPQFPKTDSNKNIVNKDFRKSTLNMDVNGVNPLTENKSVPSMNKVSQSKTMGNVPSKNLDSSSSSSESSSSDSESSESESSEDEKPAKPPPGPKPAVARAAPPLATPQRPRAGEDPTEDRPRQYVLRKFDSTDAPWWTESTKDVPTLQKTKTKSSLSKSSSKSITTASSSGEESAGLQKAPTKTKLASTKDIPGLTKSPSTLSSDDTEKLSSANKLAAGTKDVPSLSKSPSSAMSSSEEPPSVKKTKSKTKVSATKSTKDLPGLIKTASSKNVDPGIGYTPGLNRLHSRFVEERRNYRICRVESESDREWWLDDSEKETEAQRRRRKLWPDEQEYVGPLHDADIIFGNRAPPPQAFKFSDEEESDEDAVKVVGPGEVKVHDSTAKNPVIEQQINKLDDSALQLYKDGDYGSYLDLEATIDEHHEEFEAFNTKKDSIVLRTQLSVRVHTIIEKLLTVQGRDLRKALFSLKQIFLEDKDLVHEFVQNDGLSCLVRVGSETDQNNQNYILRALGQIMLYVDGMNGVMGHASTLQWLYTLVSSRYRLVVKTVLKLLLVFVEYVESNSVLLVKAIRAVDYVHRNKPWSHIMKLMKEYDSSDIDLLIYAMSLVNKTLNGLSDKDMYYDQVDALEEQGLEPIIRRYMSKQGTDLDLLRQFQIYEAVLQYEDGEVNNPQLSLKQLDETIRKAVMNRKENPVSGSERRKSRRYSTGNSPSTLPLIPGRYVSVNNNISPTQETIGPGEIAKRRRERAERQRNFLREQERARKNSSDLSSDSEPSSPRANGLVNGNGVLENGSLSPVLNGSKENGHTEGRESVRDLSQKLASSLHSPSEEGKLILHLNDMKGIISKAKEGLAKSQSRGELIKSSEVKNPEVKKSESELQWESLIGSCNRSLVLCDLDFTDLLTDDEADILAPPSSAPVPPPPPPAPFLGPSPPPALTKSPVIPTAPKAPLIPAAPKAPAIPTAPKAPTSPTPKTPVQQQQTLNKTKKTVKLFWKEVRDDPIVMSKMNEGGLLWDELSPVKIDYQKLEHLFESRAKDLITKKQQEMNKNKEVIVLDPKRSNAINIGMTKLPPPRSIKTAILKMDATVMNREGIEKLLTMLPSEEERSKIQEAQASNPELPLGSAEQFLLTLASISELTARLKLWAFKLDFENSEKEIAEPLMDLKQGMEILRGNKTFRAILRILLSIGIFLNGTEVKGFQIEYLSKVPEVKDTVHKHSLLHHLCYMVMENFPESTDLYSEIGAVTRASKVDFDELSANIQKIKQECKASFEHLKAISKHDGTTNMKLKMSDFLADCAERIIVLGKIERRVLNKFKKFCLWLGIPLHRLSSTNPNQLFRIISEFALEFRTTRERVLQQLEKKASHRERNKTRGKMITEVGKFRSQEDRADAELKQLLGNDVKSKESLSQHGSLPWRRSRKDPATVLNSTDVLNGNIMDEDDEIIESLVKTATKTPVTRTTPRERKRTRNAERKSLRRTLRNGLSEEDRKHLAAYIKGY